MSKKLPRGHKMSAHKDIVGQVMHRWKHHDPKPLHSGRGKGGKEGKVVKDQSQAIAIALSIAEKAKGGKKGSKKTSDHAERLQSLGFSEEVANKVAEMLNFADEPAAETSGQGCRPAPKPRSPKQQQQTQQAQEAAQQQGETFDQKPQQQVQQMGQQGGQAERKPQLPICPPEEKPKT